MPVIAGVQGMLKYFRRQFNIACALTDAAALAGAFFLAFFLRRDVLPVLYPPIGQKPMFGLGSYLPVLVLFGFVALGVLFAAKAYRQSPAIPLFAQFMLNAQAVGIALLGTFALAFLLKMTFLSRLFLGLFVVVFLGASTLGKHLVARWFRNRLTKGRYLKQVVIVGQDDQAVAVAQRLVTRPELGLLVHGFLSLPWEDAPPSAQMAGLGIPFLGDVDSLPAILERQVVDGVIFCVGAGRLGALEDLFLACEDLGIDTLVAANLFPHLVAQVHLERLEEMALLRFTTVPHDPVALFIKRSFDLVASAAALAVLSPLLAVVALLVKATSPGPVFFRQERVGLNGRRFTCVKYRTMVADADRLKEDLEHLNEADGPVFKIRSDPRITPLGRILRKFSLDELPQLYNVLRGDMSLVGPRPPIPSEVEKYERWQRRRLSMRPGITCLWQISGRSDLDFETWMKLDLHYIDHWSLAMDFVILLKTIPAVISTRGAA